MDNGIMDCVARSEYREVEIPLYRESNLGLNNNCNQSFQGAVQTALTTELGMGQANQKLVPSSVYLRRLSRAVFLARFDSGWEPVMSLSCAAGQGRL